MKITVSLLAAASMVAFAAPAAAQDANTFTGLWGGVIAGYDTTSVDGAGNDGSLDGVAYGVQLGYDVDLGGAVLGVEAEYADSTAKRSFTDAADSGTLEAGRDLYIGARLGAKVGPNAMLYAKGGYANARYDLYGNFGPAAYDSNIEAEGFRIGAGGEYALSPNSFMKLEYRYSNYSDADVAVAGAPGGRLDIDTDRHQVLAGVGFRF